MSSETTPKKALVAASPAKSQKKLLIIEYLYNGQRFVETAIEDSALVLPSTQSSLACSAPWIHEVEQFDRDGIHNAVITERCEIIRSNYGYSPGDRPFVEFRCTVFNGSVFPIGTSESYEGSIRFQDQPLDGVIKIGGMIVNLAHAHRGQFTIRQSLNRDEAEAISRAGPDAQFQFDLLTIYVEPGNGITPHPLSFINVYKNGRPV